MGPGPSSILWSGHLDETPTQCQAIENSLWSCDRSEGPHVAAAVRRDLRRLGRERGRLPHGCYYVVTIFDLPGISSNIFYITMRGGANRYVESLVPHLPGEGC